MYLCFSTFKAADKDIQLTQGPRQELGVPSGLLSQLKVQRHADGGVRTSGCACGRRFLGLGVQSETPRLLPHKKPEP